MDIQNSDHPIQLDKDKICIRRFQSSYDLHFINHWLKERGMPLLHLTDIPKTGFLAYPDKDHWETKIPVAAAFLRTCEGAIGFFDGLVCNPKTPLEIRSPCIDKLVHVIVNEAQFLGLKKIIAFTDNNRVFERSKKFNFQETNKKMIGLNLSKEDVWVL